MKIGDRTNIRAESNHNWTTYRAAEVIALTEENATVRLTDGEIRVVRREECKSNDEIYAIVFNSTRP